MLTASVVVHAQNGFFTSEGGYELPALLAVVAASVALAGPGAFAVDTALAIGITTVGWALAAIALGVVAAGVMGALHRAESRAATAARVRTA